MLRRSQRRGRGQKKIGLIRSIGIKREGRGRNGATNPREASFNILNMGEDRGERRKLAGVGLWKNSREVRENKKIGNTRASIYTKVNHSRRRSQGGKG